MTPTRTTSPLPLLKVDPRIETAMQTRLDALVVNRKPIIT
jgi:hypothetical protein